MSSPPTPEQKLTPEESNNVEDSTAKEPQDEAKRSPSAYVPYEKSIIETPFLSFFLDQTKLKGKINPLLLVLYKIRWKMSYPLSLRLFPKWMPYVDLPGFREIPTVTIGELLFLGPLATILALSIMDSFVNTLLKPSGNDAGWAIYATFLTANKTNSLFSFLLGVPFERMITWHYLSAALAVVTSCFHYWVAYTDDNDRDQAFIDYSFEGVTNTSGTLLVLALMLLTVPNLVPLLRRIWFELFYYSHAILAMAVIVLGIMHSITGLVAIAIWWAVDLCMRYFVMAGWKYPSEAAIRSLPADVIELSFPKPAGFEYNPGQFVMLSIPKLSVFEFHPFSISSAPHQGHVTIHIRVLGNWTKRLAKLAQKVDTVNMLMEGPFGNLALDLQNDDRYKMVLLISGGIGITPMQSLCNSLIYDHEVKGRKLKQIYFVWTVRDYGIVHALNDDVGGTTVPGGAKLALRPDSTRLDTLSFQPDLLTELHLCSSLRNNLEGDEVRGEEVEAVLHTMENTESGIVGAAGDCDRDYLNTEFYLTGTQASDVAKSPYVTLGRPNIDRIFQTMKRAAVLKGENRVAVCVCGPARLISSCRAANRKHSGGGVCFDLHEETFEL